jgi:hypothetical protein
VRFGVHAAGRGGREDMAYGSGHCILSPGWGSTMGLHVNKVAYSSAIRWREEGEAERTASRTETTRCCS